MKYETCPHTGKPKHIPELLGSGSRGKLAVRDGGNGLKTQPAVYRWMNGAGRVIPTSYEVVKVVNHKPMIRPEGNPRPSGQGGGQTTLEYN